MSILELVEEEAVRRGVTRVHAVHLQLGALSGVVEEALRSAFDMAREGSQFPDCALVVEPVEVVGHCEACGADRQVVSVSNLRCRQCGGPIWAIVRGKELDIVALEIDP